MLILVILCSGAITRATFFFTKSNTVAVLKSCIRNELSAVLKSVMYRAINNCSIDLRMWSLVEICSFRCDIIENDVGEGLVINK